MKQPTVPFLLPHERWQVRKTATKLEARNIHKTVKEKQYGPKGIIYWRASRANLPPVMIAGILCWVFIIAHPAQTSKIALYLLLVLLVFLALYAVRLIQASNAGREYRDERQQ